MDAMFDAVRDSLGLDREPLDLSIVNSAVRAVVVFFAGLVIIRLSNGRFLGKATSFDVVLGFLLGSMLSRAISGTAAFMPTLAASAMIVLLHRTLATAVYFVPALRKPVEGDPIPVIEHGTIDGGAARRMRLTEGDIEEALRVHGLTKLAEVKRAMLEVNGTVSVVPNVIRVEPIDVQAVHGAKRIRIELQLR
jgi:uncharacterized membrane protein YcaP (DUF421 family)